MRTIERILYTCVGILIIVMTVATVVFVGKGCQHQDYRVKLENDSVKIGEMSIVAFTPAGNEQLLYDTERFIPVTDFSAYIDSLNNILHQDQKELRQRQDDLIADIRQETNNNLDKMSAWLAFWITVLGFIGIACPVAYQFLNHKLMEKDVASLQEKIKHQKKEFDTINDAYNTKMTAIAFTQLCDSRLVEFDTDEMRSLYLRSIKENFNKFLSEIRGKSSIFNWFELKVHICSTLINIHSFLNRFRKKDHFEENKRAKDVMDIIENVIPKVIAAENLSKIKDDLDKINSKLSQI